MEADERECPFCAEVVKSKAKICKHCHSQLVADVPDAMEIAEHASVKSISEDSILERRQAPPAPPRISYEGTRISSRDVLSVQMRAKSAGVAMLLALLFGGIGFCYVSLIGGCIGILVAIVIVVVSMFAGVLTAPLGGIGGIFILFVGLAALNAFLAVLAYFKVNSYNQKLLRSLDAEDAGGSMPQFREEPRERGTAAPGNERRIERLEEEFMAGGPPPLPLPSLPAQPQESPKPLSKFMTDSPAPLSAELSDVTDKKWDYRYCIAALAPLVIAVAIFGLGGGFRYGFRTEGLLTDTFITGILGVGMALVLVTGGIDLSLPGIMFLAGVVAEKASYSFALPLLPLGMGIGFLLGMVNGVGVAFFSFSPAVMTVCMLFLSRAVAYIITDGPSLKVSSSDGLFSVSLLLALAAVAGGWLALQYTDFGRKLLLPGRNRETPAHPKAGMQWTLCMAYALCGMLAGLGGILYSSRMNVVYAYDNSIIECLAAAVLGGVILGKGPGRMLGVLIGALTIQACSHSLRQSFVSFYYQYSSVVLVGILLYAYLLDILSSRKNFRNT